MYYLVGEQNGYRVEVGKGADASVMLWYADSLGRLLQDGKVELNDLDGEIAYAFEVSNGYYKGVHGYFVERGLVNA